MAEERPDNAPAGPSRVTAMPVVPTVLCTTQKLPFPDRNARLHGARTSAILCRFCNQRILVKEKTQHLSSPMLSLLQLGKVHFR